MGGSEKQAKGEKKASEITGTDAPFKQFSRAIPEKREERQGLDRKMEGYFKKWEGRGSAGLYDREKGDGKGSAKHQRAKGSSLLIKLDKRTVKYLWKRKQRGKQGGA